ncbi:MAG: hypothetical protein WCO23_00420 [bacterium]
MKKSLSLAAIIVALAIMAAITGCGGTDSASTTPPTPVISFDEKGTVLAPADASPTTTQGISIVPYYDDTFARGGASAPVTYCRFDGKKWILAPGQYKVFMDEFASARNRSVRGGMPETKVDFAFQNLASSQVLASPKDSQHILTFNYAGSWSGGAIFSVNGNLQYATTNIEVVDWEEIAKLPILSVKLKNHIEGNSGNDYHEKNTLLTYFSPQNGLLNVDSGMALIACIQVDNIFTDPTRGGDNSSPGMWDEVYISGRNADMTSCPGFHFTGGYTSEGIGTPFAFSTAGTYYIQIQLLKEGKIVSPLLSGVNVTIVNKD